MIHLVVTQKASPQKIFGVRVKALVEGRTLGHCIEFGEAEDFDGHVIPVTCCDSRFAQETALVVLAVPLGGLAGKLGRTLLRQILSAWRQPWWVTKVGNEKAQAGGSGFEITSGFTWSGHP